MVDFAYAKNRCAFWRCKCDCGNEIVVKGTNLRDGTTKSCGCIQKEKAAEKCRHTATDITGQRFGRLVVLQRAGSDKNQKATFLCKCDCGNTVVVAGKYLRNGATKSCGCLKHEKHIEPLSLIGRRFGRLLVKEYLGTNASRDYIYHCLCDCGKETTSSLRSLLSGHTTSCGCKRDEHFNGYKHGKSRTNIYQRWQYMKQRCYNPHSRRYKEYGGRGIKVCEEWLHNPVAFYEWAISNGYSPELTLDRINVNGDYEPTNCRWVDYATQNNNTRRTRKITVDGEAFSLKQLSRQYNVPYGQILKNASDERRILELIGRKDE